jgi:hypothetical protein
MSFEKSVKSEVIPLLEEGTILGWAEDGLVVEITSEEKKLVDPLKGKVSSWMPSKAYLKVVLPPVTSVARPAELNVPAEVSEFLKNEAVRVAWVSGGSGAKILRKLEKDPNAYTIVVLHTGKFDSATSNLLRKWVEQSGIVWAFDRSMTPTWRNKILFGSDIKGAELEWQDPDDKVVWIDEGKLTVCNVSASYAKNVKSVFLGDDNTTRTDPATGHSDISARIGWPSDESVTPLLKGKAHGPAFINLDRQYEYRMLAGNESRHMGIAQPHAIWTVTVGFAKKVGRGYIVILPSIDLKTGDGAQFLANLAEWCWARTKIARHAQDK